MDIHRVSVAISLFTTLKYLQFARNNGYIASYIAYTIKNNN